MHRYLLLFYHVNHNQHINRYRHHGGNCYGFSLTLSRPGIGTIVEPTINTIEL